MTNSYGKGKNNLSMYMAYWKKGAYGIWKKNNNKKTYMPYLTLWDKISQNLAHLEGNAHKKPISQNLQIILQQILWRNKHKSNNIVVFTSFLHEKKNIYI